MICFLQKYCFKVPNLHTFSPRGPGLPKPPGGPWGPWNTEKIKDETALTFRQWSSSAGCPAHTRPTDERLTSAPLGPAGPRGPGGPGGPWSTQDAHVWISTWIFMMITSNTDDLLELTMHISDTHQRSNVSCLALLTRRPWQTLQDRGERCSKDQTELCD